MTTEATRSSTTRAERRADAARTGGFVRCSFARSTGTLVIVLDALNGGDWLVDPTTAERWVTLCDDHATLCTHETRHLAQSHAACPEGWCEDCMDISDADEELAEQQAEPIPAAVRDSGPVRVELLVTDAEGTRVAATMGVGHDDAYFRKVVDRLADEHDSVAVRIDGFSTTYPVAEFLAQLGAQS